MILFGLVSLSCQLTITYNFTRVCETCSSCKSSVYGPYCVVEKGGPYDNIGEDTCTDKAYCDQYYPERIQISQSNACRANQCLSSSTFINGYVLPSFCETDQKRCTFDPNATNSALIFILFGVGLGLIIIGLVGYKCYKRSKGKKDLLLSATA